MCLSVPAKIISIEGDMAQVKIGGTTLTTGLQLLEYPKIGEYVLIHSGFAISKLSEEDAAETLKLLQELGEIDEQIRNSENTI
ncbi:MAG: HypC/HybG/HupF family hydrogenase formation chaperone [Bacteroidetes bacterium]|nr:HypC/HybG/HupF family hydrogenase formation chaperone [Bacteroidota bacterium]